MPRTRSQTAALLAQQITELAMGDMTSRITNTPNKKHKTPPNKQNTPKKKKKRRKRGSSLSMRKKATNTKGQGDGSENNPYTATRRSTKRRIKQSNLNEKRRHETQKNAIRKEIQCEFEQKFARQEYERKYLSQRNSILETSIKTMKNKVNLNQEKINELLNKISVSMSSEHDEYVYVCTDDTETDEESCNDG
eukprot:30301_1